MSAPAPPEAGKVARAPLGWLRLLVLAGVLAGVLVGLTAITGWTTGIRIVIFAEIAAVGIYFIAIRARRRTLRLHHQVTIIVLLAVAFYFLFQHRMTPDFGPESPCFLHLREVGAAIEKAWAEGRHPQGYDSFVKVQGFPMHGADRRAVPTFLVEKGYAAAKILVCPEGGEGGLVKGPGGKRALVPAKSGYLWTGRVIFRQGTTPFPIAADAPGNHPAGRHVLYSDGAVRAIPEAEYRLGYRKLIEED